MVLHPKVGETSDIFAENAHIFGRKFYGRVQKRNKVVVIFGFIKWAFGQNFLGMDKNFEKSDENIGQYFAFWPKKVGKWPFLRYKSGHIVQLFLVHFVSFLGDFGLFWAVFDTFCVIFG